jgi:hypothetical protein
MKRNESMAVPCSESTVMVNTTHKILSEFQPFNPHLVATVPTTNMENVLGYDTAFSSWKLFLLQYKRPYVRNGRFYFYLNASQNWQLLYYPVIFGAPCAFFPLVLVSSDQDLAAVNPQLLDNVIFVNVMDIWPGDATTIRVDRTDPTNIQVHWKELHFPWNQLLTYYLWGSMRRDIQRCGVGGLMKEAQRPTESNSLLRELIHALSRNTLPRWFRRRIEDFARRRDLTDNQTSRYLRLVDNALTMNRAKEMPTTIASRSFRAFIYPIE